MFARLLQLKFPSVAEAKLASQNLSDTLCARISKFDFHVLHVTVGKEGEIAVNIRFENPERMLAFEKEIPTLLEDIKAAFAFKQSKFSGVCAYSFEREAMATTLTAE